MNQDIATSLQGNISLYDNLQFAHSEYEAISRLLKLINNEWIGEKIFNSCFKEREFYTKFKDTINQRVIKALDPSIIKAREVAVEKLTAQALELIAEQVEIQIRQHVGQLQEALKPTMERAVETAKQSWTNYFYDTAVSVGQQIQQTVQSVTTYTVDTYEMCKDKVVCAANSVTETVSSYTYSASSRVLSDQHIEICKQILWTSWIEVQNIGVQVALQQINRAIEEKIEEGIQREMALAAVKNSFTGSLEQFKEEALTISQECLNQQLEQNIEQESLKDASKQLVKSASTYLKQGDWDQLIQESNTVAVKLLSDQAHQLVDTYVKDESINLLSKESITLILEGKKEEAVALIKQQTILKLKQYLIPKLNQALESTFKEASVVVVKQGASFTVDFGVKKSAQYVGLTVATGVAIPIIQSMGSVMGYEFSTGAMLMTPACIFMTNHFMQNMWHDHYAENRKLEQCRILLVGNMRDPVLAAVQTALTSLGYSLDKKNLETGIDLTLIGSIDLILSKNLEMRKIGNLVAEVFN